MSNLRQAAEGLSAEERTGLFHHLKSAMFHMTSCWDELREAETMLDNSEVEESDIAGYAVGLDNAAEAFSVPDEHLLEILEGIEAVVV